MLRSLTAGIAAALLLCGDAVCTLDAQEVRGVASASESSARSGVPLAGTSVVLVDEQGRIAAGTITDSIGSFRLRAPAPGMYRIRVRRIGFAPDSSNVLALQAGASAEFDPVLHTFAVSLSTVRVDAAERCRIAPEAGALAQQLWEDAQSALTATVVGGWGADTAFVLRRFERELEPDGQTVRAARTWDAVTRSSEPYASIPAESLAAHGFVVPQGSSLAYYAPDARTLISDAFARGHCFRPVERDDHPAQIGLAFTPTGRRARARRDISGALWIARATGRLVDLELTYATPPEFASASFPAATARLEYDRTPSGRWIVDHWVLRMPVVSMQYVAAPRSGSTLEMGAVLTREQVPVLSAVWEAGGDVVRTLAATDTTLDAVGSVSGRFLDTVNVRGTGARVDGVPGIRVVLDAIGGTVGDPRYTALSDSAGQFTVGRVRPGEYTVRVEGNILDTLDVHVSSRNVTVSAATTQMLVTTIPSIDAAARNLCSSGIDDREAVLHGTVRDADARPVARARVVVSWFSISNGQSSQFSARTETRATVTDSEGSYVICGIPRNRRLSAQAIVGVRKGPSADVEASNAAIRLLTLTLPELGGAP